MFGVLFKLMFAAMGAFLLCFAAGQALRSARRLDRRIAQFKAEQREREEQGRAVHPYAELGQLYAEEPPESNPVKRRASPRRAPRSD